MTINEAYRQQDVVENFTDYLEREIISVQEQDFQYCDSCGKTAAESVAGFLRPANGMCFNSCDVTLLLSRALWSVGCGAVAQRLLEKQRIESGFPIVCSGMIEGSNASFSAWRALVSVDAVRSRALTAFESQMVLILDFRRLFPTESGIIELALFRGLYRLLDVVACFWDTSGGKGVLGLKDVPETASDCLGLYGKRRSEFVDEVIGFCSKRLDLLKDTRSWAYAPQVINLDLRRL